jgi:hypothetical protein
MPVDAAGPGQSGMDLADAVDAVVLRMNLLDLLGDLLVTDGPGRGWAGLAGVVRARGDGDLSVAEDSTDAVASLLPSSTPNSCLC